MKTSILVLGLFWASVQASTTPTASTTPHSSSKSHPSATSTIISQSSSPTTFQTSHVSASNSQKPSQTVTGLPPDAVCTPLSSENEAETICSCDNGWTLPQNLYYNGTATTTACANSPSLASTWVEVPKIGQGGPAWASPVPEACNSPGQGLNSSCWKELDLTDYVKWWSSDVAPKLCGGHPDANAFADCFMNVLTLGDNHCTNITTDSSCTPPTFKQLNGQWNNVRNYYVAETIFNLYNFVVEYETAIYNSGGILLGNLTTITGIIDPPPPPPPPEDTGLDTFLQILSFGVSLIPDTEGVEGMLADVTGAFKDAAEKSEAILDLLAPKSDDPNSGPVDDTAAVILTSQSSIQAATGQFSKNVLKAGELMLKDGNTFVSVVGSGAFTSALPPLTDITDALTKQWNIFMVSQVFQAKNVSIGRFPDTDLSQFYTNGSKPTLPKGVQLNCSSYDKYDVCDTYWFDKTDKVTYGLFSSDMSNTYAEMGKDWNSVMTQLFENGYITPEQLFLNAQQCGGKSASMSLINSENEQANCMNNLKVCTWNMSPEFTNHGDDQVPGWSPFTDCDVSQVIPGFKDHPYCLPYSSFNVGQFGSTIQPCYDGEQAQAGSPSEAVRCVVRTASFAAILAWASRSHKENPACSQWDYGSSNAAVLGNRVVNCKYDPVLYVPGRISVRRRIKPWE